MTQTESMKSKPRVQAGVQSVENGLELVLLLAKNRRAMKLTEVAARVGISPAKAHRYLVSFVRAGFVTQDLETGLYGLGPVALEFSLACLATLEPIEIASKEARILSAETGCTVSICVWGSFGPTVVRWNQPTNPVMVNVGLGSVYPLYHSATGRIFAAFMPPEVIRKYVASTPVGSSGKKTPGETVEEVRKRGMSRSYGQHIEGMASFCAPVFDANGALALSMTILGYKESFDYRWDSPLASMLRDTANRCSKQLGYQIEPSRQEALNRGN
ncbi:IclR family transcriptional regulator [Candidimonas sp. SYP-B2681]|uniref:IclR family transcriptional regulator n=1 Tax=Candidimonas sp. SYP-B2681 TaxID=2497686 RepID=UPI000F86B02A|nr:IclR family transcriptional regulator [Candidimonas sp. SYP-B2681]RTZ45468.1 IclR family transcriptional regulator [Candidimonas sp. SYP-B2681]